MSTGLHKPEVPTHNPWQESQGSASSAPGMGAKLRRSPGLQVGEILGITM